MRILRWISCTTFLLIFCGEAIANDFRKFDGLIVPDKLIAVSSPIPGVLDRVPFDKGDHVKKGQLIASLKSGVERAAVDLAKAKYANSKKRMERNHQLSEKRLISQMDNDDIETEALLAEMELRQAEEQLALRIIRSPVSGVVVDRNYSPGEFVQESEIIKVAILDPLKVEVILPVEMYSQVRNGLVVSVKVNGYESPYEGVITLVDPIVDAASGSFAVRIRLPNPQYLLLAGLKCRVSFPESKKRIPDEQVNEP